VRFLVDESTGPAVASWLRAQGHEVFSVYDEARGIVDEAIIQKAFTEHWILLTNDKDFGEKVYRDRHRHRGVVLLRLADERAGNKIETLRRVLAMYAEQLADRFVVAPETRVRFARSSPADQRDSGPSEC
jgi:predicted nuclease of predicted toxin-antitoxin system